MVGPCPAGRESDRGVTASNIGAHRAKTDSERKMSFFGGHDVSVTREPSGLELVVYLGGRSLDEVSVLVPDSEQRLLSRRGIGTDTIAVKMAPMITHSS